MSKEALSRYLTQPDECDDEYDEWLDTKKTLRQHTSHGAGICVLEPSELYERMIKSLMDAKKNYIQIPKITDNQ